MNIREFKIGEIISYNAGVKIAPFQLVETNPPMGGHSVSMELKDCFLLTVEHEFYSYPDLEEVCEFLGVERECLTVEQN